ncbi:ATP synthase mitochondrial F1 complex assembly factor 1-like [Planoprotostelium fungivorum]|uniref:ATP synthase mitochondrial F1 complex assembly factor 1-like n=1 Tax=Planoprotostelium fungivorum TaxID=1890364 RepID=A0A2P6N282_9EUKA|nr:ATP synthase mitochondrial F1 complex assembly factor 1-like [Planoprotostelium fungivorum]
MAAAFTSRLTHHAFLNRSIQLSKPALMSRNGRFCPSIQFNRSVVRHPLSRALSTFSPTKKSLGSMAKVDLLQSLPADEVKKVWITHLRDKDALGAVVPSETFQKISSRSTESPLFVVPMPFNGGFLSILLQADVKYNDNTIAIHFTRLEMYQKEGSAAQPILNLFFFTDFQAAKDIVLMKGEYGFTSSDLTPTQCQQLIQLWQMFVLSDKNYELMRKFNHEPSTFKFDDVLDVVRNFSSEGDGGLPNITLDQRDIKS